LIFLLTSINKSSRYFRLTIKTKIMNTKITTLKKTFEANQILFFLGKLVVSLCIMGLGTNSLFSQNIFQQTDWSGGPGQTYPIDDETMFDFSNNVDYSTTPGQISGDFIHSSGDRALFYFHDRLYISKNEGLFTLDRETKELSYIAAIPIRQQTAWTILNDTLYVLSGWNVYSNDGTDNDYGMGSNGWQIHSVFPSAGLGTVRSLGIHNGELYAGARTTSSNGRVYKYSMDTWSQIGGNFEVAVDCLLEYNGELYAGTHWYGHIYKLDEERWVRVYSPASMMRVYQMIEYNGNLYAAIYKNTHKDGLIVKYDGTTWTVIYSGYASKGMVVIDNELYVSTRKSPSQGFTEPGGILKTSDGTNFEEVYSLGNHEFWARMASDSTDLYYGSVKVSDSLAANIYKNGEVFTEFHVGQLSSSTFMLEPGLFYHFSYTIGADTGGSYVVLHQGKPDAETEWGIDELIKSVANETDLLITNPMNRYQFVFWSNSVDYAPVLSSIGYNGNLLTVAVNDTVKTYGDEDPAYLISYDGFKNDDDESDLSGSLIIERETGETVGNYTVSANGLASDYYHITYESGILEITPKELTIDGSFTVHNKEHDGSADGEIDENNLHLTGKVGDDDVHLQDVIVKFGDADVGNDKKVVIESATLGGDDKDNYTLTLDGAPTATASIIDVATYVKENNLPIEFALYQNYPNPFNPTTTIRYAIPERVQVRISMYNTLGREMITIMNGIQEAGYYEHAIDFSPFPSGVYIYRLQAGEYVESMKLLYLK